MPGIRSVMVVAGVWLLSAPASAAYFALDRAPAPEHLVPEAVTCALDVTRQTDAILPVHLYNQTRLRPQDLEVIARIADAVWRRYQVRVALAGPAAAALRVTVVDKSSPQARTQGPIPVASTVFDQGHATPTIYLWLGSAERLAASRPWERDFSELPRNLQNLRLSRILGVSLAHEIGHFLLDSASHSTRGLLRATMSTPQMLDPLLKDLVLDDQQIASLCRKLPALKNDDRHTLVTNANDHAFEAVNTATEARELAGTIPSDAAQDPFGASSGGRPRVFRLPHP